MLSKGRQIFILIFLLLISDVLVFSQQIDISRIELMPNFPQPFEMRNWKEVAQKYDSLVFDLNATGNYFPLTEIVENTINYPEHVTFGIQSYVGGGTPGMEAINIIPAVIGASLSGIDKSDQFGYNWPLLCEEYFNRKPDENIYLNNPNTSSGHDWWYETMPNVFFYQLNYLYPNTGDFNYQFVTIADQWFEAVKAMGGNDTPWTLPYMNYRAFFLSTMTPLEMGVKEPEAAGAIAWILYNAYIKTGNKEYCKAAEWCLEFLENQTNNPAYELQLSYGVYTAARMNAELGTNYNIEKMVNWCFEVGELRNWGAIIGNWSGYDVSGLIGEARENYRDYAFNMNSLEQASALVPMVRYDNRFAKAIGKWILNMANASRLFYSYSLPYYQQDNEDWTTENDPESAIAYEALMEKTSGPYATGDAMNGGWAETNLGLYGSSHVGILGGIIKETNVEGILQLNMLATDYYRDSAYQTYLLYNPFQKDTTVNIELPGGLFDIYDAVSNQIIQNNMIISSDIDLPANNAMILVYIPAGSTIEINLNKSMVNGIVIDYNNGLVIENYPPRIKSLALNDSIAVINSISTLYCTATDIENDSLSYYWFIDDVEYAGGENLNWQVPSETGYYNIKCLVIDEGGLNATDSILVKVLDEIDFPPVINSIKAEPPVINISEISEITCNATDQNNNELFYHWHATEGYISGSGNVITYNAPDNQGNYYIICEVSDEQKAIVTDSILILVRDPVMMQTGKLVANYDFQGDAQDYSGFGNHGIVSNCQFSDDILENPNSAVFFNQSSSKITVQNTDLLNFTEGISVCFWLNVTQFYDRESYVISHGSWQDRWKISIGNHQLRFTLNGDNGFMDLDSKTALNTNEWVHVVAIYNGWDCELYFNAELESVNLYEGAFHTTSYDLVLGQSLPNQTGFNFNGLLDKVKIYNYGISYETIKNMYENELSLIRGHESEKYKFEIYPNLTSQFIRYNIAIEPNSKATLSLINNFGFKMLSTQIYTNENGDASSRINVTDLKPGIYFLKLIWNNMYLVRKVVIFQ